MSIYKILILTKMFNGELDQTISNIIKHQMK